MAAAGLHRQVLLRPDRIGHRRALERRAHVEAPQLLERLVVVGHHPAVLQRGEHQAARRRRRARSDLDIGDRLAQHLVVDGVERRQRAVVEIAAVLPRLAGLVVHAAVLAQHADRGAGLREAPLGTHAVGDVLHRVEGERLVRHAAMPRRARALLAVAAQRPRLGVVDLHVELRVVLVGFPGLRVDALGPVQIVDVLFGLDEAAVGAVDRIEEAVAPEVAHHLALLPVDRRVVEQKGAGLVVIPRVVRRVLEVPRQLAGGDVERDDRVRVQVVARPELRVVDRERVAGADDVKILRRVVGPGLPDAAAAGLPGVVIVLPRSAARVAGLRHRVPAPQLRAAVDVERRHPAAGAAVARAVLHQDFAVGYQRCGEEALLVAELVLHRDLPVPDDLAVLAVDGDDAAVWQVGDHLVFPERDAARARHVAFVLDAGVGHPHEAAAARIARVDLVDGAPAVARVHEPVVDERVQLALGTVLSDVLHPAERHRPDHAQVLHVLPVDLRQLGVAERAVVAVHQQPVLRLVPGVDQAILVDGQRILGGQRGRRDGDGTRDCGKTKGSGMHARILGQVGRVGQVGQVGRVGKRSGRSSDRPSAGGRP